MARPSLCAAAGLCGVHTLPPPTSPREPSPRARAPLNPRTCEEPPSKQGRRSWRRGRHSPEGTPSTQLTRRYGDTQGAVDSEQGVAGGGRERLAWPPVEPGAGRRETRPCPAVPRGSRAHRHACPGCCEGAVPLCAKGRVGTVERPTCQPQGGQLGLPAASVSLLYWRAAAWRGGRSEGRATRRPPGDASAGTLLGWVVWPTLPRLRGRWGADGMPPPPGLTGHPGAHFPITIICSKGSH